MAQIARVSSAEITSSGRLAPSSKLASLVPHLLPRLRLLESEEPKLVPVPGLGPKEKAAAIGRYARQFCLAKFDIEHFADEIVQFIEESNPGAMRRLRQGTKVESAGIIDDADAEAAGAAH